MPVAVIEYAQLICQLKIMIFDTNISISKMSIFLATIFTQISVILKNILE